MKGLPVSDKPFLYERRGAIAYLTFNRPQARNAISPEVLCRLADAWHDFAQDDALRVAIVTGAQDKAFTAGADLARMIPLLSKARAAEDEWDRRVLADPEAMRDITTLRTFPLYKPVIAAINGACIGAGTEMLQAMDIRIAAEHATFALTEVALGFMPGGGSTVRLPRQIPYCKAMEMLLLGTPISAQEAWRIGLINEVVPATEVMSRAEAIAQKIAANGPFAARKIKETVLRTSGLSLEEAFRVDSENYLSVIASEDAKEGPRAFMERRPPVFKGR